MVAMGVAVTEGMGVFVAVGMGVFVLVEATVGVEVEMGVPVESRLHMLKSFAKNGPLKVSWPRNCTACVPAGMGIQ